MDFYNKVYKIIKKKQHYGKHSGNIRKCTKRN